MSWGGLSAVDGGQKLFRQCELLLLFISCIYFFQQLFVPLSSMTCGSSLRWTGISLWIPPSKSCLINKPASSWSPCFQPSVQFWSVSAKTALFVRELLQNVLKVAQQLQVEWCRWLTAAASVMEIMLLLSKHFSPKMNFKGLFQL